MTAIDMADLRAAVAPYGQIPSLTLAIERALRAKSEPVELSPASAGSSRQSAARFEAIGRIDEAATVEVTLTNRWTYLDHLAVGAALLITAGCIAPLINSPLMGLGMPAGLILWGWVGGKAARQ